MRELFTRLLNDFMALAVERTPSGRGMTIRLGSLIQDYGECRRRVDQLERSEAAQTHVRIRDMIEGHNASVERDRQFQEAVADDFNLLEVLRLTGKELRHSMMLAWLLDHDLRKLGTHAQRKLGFRLFLEEFCDHGLRAEYVENNYWVRREVAGDESIVDVEIACRGQFLIHIENKIWSGEGNDQTDREWSDLRRRSAVLGVGADNVHALYLTPGGTRAANQSFRPISWGRIARVLERFAEQAKPPEVRLFAGHYARALTRFIATRDRAELADAQAE